MTEIVGDEVTRALRALERERDELSNAYALLIGKRPTLDVLKKAHSLKLIAAALYVELEREAQKPA